MTDDIDSFELSFNAERVTSVTFITKLGVTHTIGTKLSTDTIDKNNFKAENRKYKLFGFVSSANPDGTLKNLEMVMWERSCNLTPDLPIPPQDFKVDDDVLKTNKKQITLTWEDWSVNKRGAEPTSWIV